MSRINVLRKGSLFLIIGVLAIAITLSGCDSPVGSATETPAPRDGVMRVLPDRFALDMPGALLPQADSEVQPLSVRTSSGDPGSVDGIFEILEGEYVNALMYNAFWFLIADEILSSPDVDVDQVSIDFDFEFDDDLADRLDEYFKSIPLYELIRENERYESSEWNSYREDDILGNTFIATYSYIQSNSDIYDHSFRMLIAYKEMPDLRLADINIFWSNDLKRSAFFGNSETSFGGDDRTDNITFFALDEEKGESFYLFVEFENEQGDSLNFEEANFREHPSLSKGVFFLGKGSADGDVILGVADDDGYSLQVGNGQREYRDSSRKIIPSAGKYDFDVNTDFAGMDAVATLLDSGFEIRPRFRPVLTNSND